MDTVLIGVELESLMICNWDKDEDHRRTVRQGVFTERIKKRFPVTIQFA